MSRRLVIEARALDRAAGFLADDPSGLAAVFEALDRLLENPRPVESFPLGSPDLRRLRVGRYRVLYEIHEDEITIDHLNRTAAPLT